MKILAVFHPTPFCNLNCRYCWAPNRSDKSVMPISILEKTLEQIHENKNIDGVEVLWLTGEPLVMGLDYFNKAVDVCRQKSPATIQPTFVIQTNGTLIDKAWCEFFLKNNFVVGVSIDGPQEIHDAQRKHRDGRGSFSEAERGVHLLMESGVRGGAICVITKETLRFPPETLFQYFHDRGIAWSYLIEAGIGDNVMSETSFSSADGLRLEAYLSRLLDLWADSPKSYIRVFDQTARRVFGGIQPLQDKNNLGCLDILNVSYDGSFFWGNPELMSATLGPLRSVKYNLTHDDVWGCRFRPEFSAYENEVHAGVSNCRKSCAFFMGCQGGNPAHKYYEFGRFDVTDHASCMLNDQIVQPLMLKKIGVSS